MVTGVWGSWSTSRQLNMIEAVSSTAPAAVIQELLVRGERKNASAGCEVWLSSSSTNHRSQSSQVVAKYSSPRTRWMRIRNTGTLGGLPARTSSLTTSASRRENAE
jgi:hypothetical protein